MFESAIVNVLNRLLGNYVADLEYNQLNVGIWSGNVVLRDLKLKREALDELFLPLEMIEGYLGQLVLNIPWKNLGGQAVEIVIDKLFLLVAPKRGIGEELDAKRNMNLKLQKLEAEEILSQDISMNRNVSFVNHLVTKIMDNISIKIQNIHVRYQDVYTCHPFSIGCTLSALSTSPKLADRASASLVEKTLNLEGLSVYWNTGHNGWLDLESFEKMIKSFETLIPLGSGNKLPHQYVIHPISGTGTLVMENTSWGQTKSRLDLVFDEIRVELDNEQYLELLRLIRNSPGKQVQPSRASGEHAREWVVSIFRAVMENIRAKNAPWTWEYQKHRRRNRQRYIHLYKSQRTLRAVERSLERIEENELRELEKTLDYDDVILYRSIARDMLEQESLKGKGWFSSLFAGWWGTKSDDSSVVSANRDDVEHYTSHQLMFRLNSGSWCIKTHPHGTSTSLIDFSFLGVTIRATNQERIGDQYPRAIFSSGGKWELEILLTDLYTKDTWTERSRFKALVRSRKQQNDDHLFEFRYNSQATNQSGELQNQIYATMNQLVVVANKYVIHNIIRFFAQTPENESKIGSEENAFQFVLTPINSKIEEIKTILHQEVDRVLSRHKQVCVNIHVRSPIFLVPIDIENPASPLFVADFGYARMETQFEHGLLARSHDMYNFELSSVNVLYVPTQQLYFDQLEGLVVFREPGNVRDFHLLFPIDVNVVVHVYATALFPRLKLCVQAQNLEITVSEERIEGLFRLWNWLQFDSVFPDAHLARNSVVEQGGLQVEVDLGRLVIQTRQNIDSFVDLRAEGFVSRWERCGDTTGLECYISAVSLIRHQQIRSQFLFRSKSRNTVNIALNKKSDGHGVIEIANTVGFVELETFVQIYEWLNRVCCLTRSGDLIRSSDPTSQGSRTRIIGKNCELVLFGDDFYASVEMDMLKVIWEPEQSLITITTTCITTNVGQSTNDEKHFASTRESVSCIMHWASSNSGHIHLKGTGIDVDFDAHRIFGLYGFATEWLETRGQSQDFDFLYDIELDNTRVFFKRPEKSVVAVRLGETKLSIGPCAVVNVELMGASLYVLGSAPSCLIASTDLDIQIKIDSDKREIDTRTRLPVVMQMDQEAYRCMVERLFWIVDNVSKANAMNSGSSDLETSLSIQSESVRAVFQDRDQPLFAVELVGPSLTHISSETKNHLDLTIRQVVVQKPANSKWEQMVIHNQDMQDQLQVQVQHGKYIDIRIRHLEMVLFVSVLHQLKTILIDDLVMDDGGDSGPVQLSAICHGFRGYLVQDGEPNQQDEAVIVDIQRCTLDFHHSGELRIHSLKISLGFVDSNTECRTLIEPFNTELLLNARISTCSLPMIVSRLSFVDILVLKRIIEFNQQSMWRLTDGSSLTEPGSWDIDCPSIQLTIVDDTCRMDLPILEMILEAIGIESGGTVTNTQWTFKSRIHMNLFNIKNSMWEPLVEPWEFAIVHNRVELEEPDGQTRHGNGIRVEGMERMEMNLTHHFIERVLQVYPRVRDLEMRWRERGCRRHAQANEPYLIRNHTGCNILIWSNQLVGGPGQELDNGKEMVLHHKEKGYGQDCSLCRINVHFQDHEWATLWDISVYKEDAVVVELKPQLGDTLHMILVKVHIDNDHRKVVEISSGIVFVNDTCIPIDMQNHGEIQTIGPFKQLGIAPEKGYQGTFRLRPGHASGWEWSRDFGWSDCMHQTEMELECKVSSGESRYPFFMGLSRMVIQNDPYPLMKIHIRGVMILHNILPYDIDFVLIDRESRFKYQERLNKNQTIYLHSVSQAHLIGMTLDVILGTHIIYRSKSLTIINRADRSEPLYLEIEMVGERRESLVLRLAEERDDSPGSTRKIIIYSPYVILNQTNHVLEFGHPNGSESVVISRPEPVPTLFSYKAHGLKNRVCVRIQGEKEWSRPISFEAVGGQFELQTQGSEPQCFGYSISLGSGIHSRTKVIVFSPRYVAWNFCEYGLLIGRASSETKIIELERECRQALDFGWEKDSRLVRLCKNGRWSHLIDISKVGQFFVDLDQSFHSETDFQQCMANGLERCLKPGIGLIRVDIALEGSVLNVGFRQAEYWPFVLINTTPLELGLRERHSQKSWILKSNSAQGFVWKDPNNADNGIELCVGTRLVKLQISEIGISPPILLDTSNTLMVDIVAAGPSFHVYFKMMEPWTTALCSTSPATEAASVLIQEIDIEVVGFGISLVDQNARELFYVYGHEMMLSYKKNREHTTYGCLLDWLQIDNQILGDDVPNVLVPGCRNSKTKYQPFLKIGVIQANDNKHGVPCFPYAGILLQELSIRLGEGMLKCMVEFWTFPTEQRGEHDPFWTLYFPPLKPVRYKVEHNSKLYFEIFQCHPVKINLSFTRNEELSKRDYLIHSNGLFGFFVDVLAMAIGNIHNAPLKFNSFVLQNSLVDPDSLWDFVYDHYSQQAIQQFHKLVGSADFLGNPIGLFNTFCSGVVDLFYEPYQGFVSDRPQDFGLGIARGGASLLKNTVYGVSDTLSKFTQSIGKGLSLTTFDDKYQKERRRNRRNQPRHAISGVATGAKSLIASVASGLSGVIEQPVEGAVVGGVPGFLKGIGRGLVGIVTKPVVGVFDMAASVTEGIRNTAKTSEDETPRIRLPRAVAGDGVLRRYSEQKSFGQFLLHECDNGKYSGSHYIDHFETKPNRDICIVSSNEVVGMVFGRSAALWIVYIDELKSVGRTADSIRLHTKRDDTRIIRLGDEETQRFVEALEKAIAVRHLSN